MKEPLARSCLAMFDAPCTISPAEIFRSRGRAFEEMFKYFGTSRQLSSTKCFKNPYQNSLFDVCFFVDPAIHAGFFHVICGPHSANGTCVFWNASLAGTAQGLPNIR